MVVRGDAAAPSRARPQPTLRSLRLVAVLVLGTVTRPLGGRRRGRCTRRECRALDPEAHRGLGGRVVITAQGAVDLTFTGDQVA